MNSLFPLLLTFYMLVLLGLVVASLASFLRGRKKLQKLDFRFDELGDELPSRAAVCVMDPQTCIWCVRLEESTLRNESVRACAEAHGVRLVRCRPSDFSRLAGKRGWSSVRGMPTIVFVGADGSEAGRKVGFCRPEEMCELIGKYLAEPTSGLPSKPASETAPGAAPPGTPESQ